MKTDKRALLGDRIINLKVDISDFNNFAMLMNRYKVEQNQYFHSFFYFFGSFIDFMNLNLPH